MTFIPGPQELLGPNCAHMYLHTMMESVHLFLPLPPCIHLDGKSGNFSRIVAFFLLGYATGLGRENFAVAAQPSSALRCEIHIFVCLSGPSQLWCDRLFASH